MTTEIQLSPNACDPIKMQMFHDPCFGDALYAIGIIPYMQSEFHINPANPQDIGVETFSTDPLMRYPPMEAE